MMRGDKTPARKHSSWQVRIVQSKVILKCPKNAVRVSPLPKKPHLVTTWGYPVRKLIRPLAAAVCIACLAVFGSVISTERAMAQAQTETPVKQMALTKKQIEGVLAARDEMDVITEKLPENAMPDKKMLAQLEGLAKKNGFASYDEYNDVVDNISLVLAGFDPMTKKYIGDEAVIKAQIARVQANKKMPAKDKQATLADLNEALKSPATPIENKGNIDLVAAYYDKLTAETAQ